MGKPRIFKWQPTTSWLQYRWWPFWVAGWCATYFWKVPTRSWLSSKCRTGKIRQANTLARRYKYNGSSTFLSLQFQLAVSVFSKILLQWLSTPSLRPEAATPAAARTWPSTTTAAKLTTIISSRQSKCQFYRFKFFEVLFHFSTAVTTRVLHSIVTTTTLGSACACRRRNYGTNFMQSAMKW